MSMFRSSALRLMLAQLYESVYKWIHEPKSNFNHKKHLSNAFTCTHFLAYTYKTQKYLPRIIFNLFALSYFILCHLHHVLDNHSVDLGTQEKEVVFQVPWRRTMRAFSTVPQEFNIKP
jgi:hypothetical protein